MITDVFCCRMHVNTRETVDILCKFLQEFLIDEQRSTELCTQNNFSKVQNLNVKFLMKAIQINEVKLSLSRLLA